jgi:two-component system sensor histidine kinase SenX3
MQSSVEQVIKLEKLSEGLLELSQSDSQAPTIAPISLSQVTSEAMNRVIEQAQAKRISIEDATPNSRIMGNQDAVVQAVTILLDNAIKYSHRGSTIYLESNSEGKYQLLHMKDEGIGINATDLPHIFERFYRADNARTKLGEHGYGLGLSIAKKLVENSRGKLTVQSALGKGSTFTIKLPRSQP